jgi:2-haloalkanoic acid dehalogenase type II
VSAEAGDRRTAPPRPALISFDLFGTVLDWRSGLAADLARAGVTMDDAMFDAIVDAQGADEQAAFRPYTEIVARSLVAACALAPSTARVIGDHAGHWPLYADSAEALAQLAEAAPLAALTNSDRAHRPGVEAQTERKFDYWICAQEVGAYKPDPRMWAALAARVAPAGILPGPSWWHVSAYADYDLGAARALGLTCVFVERPHSRRGDPALADVVVVDLAELAALLDGTDAR